MQLSASNKPMPLPVLPTTGPADWAGLPIATFDWNAYSARPVFLSRDGVTKLDGVASLEGALAAASRASYQVRDGATVATAILQAKDGAFYLGSLASNPGASAKRDSYYLPNNGTTRVESVTPLVDALKAVVGGTSWVRFDTKAGDTATPIEV
jgi:hypothetical protein